MNGRTNDDDDGQMAGWLVGHFPTVHTLHTRELEPYAYRYSKLPKT